MIHSAHAEGSAWSEREVALPSEPAPLYGTLALPDGTAACDGVLILPGSGPVDRDGNYPGGINNSLRLLAQGLAARGIASLRIDKRGVARSVAAAPREEDLRFDTYVGDAVRWLERLRAESRIVAVSLLGHSEGALVATLVAERSEVRRLVLIAGAGTRAGIALRRQLAASSMPPSLRESAETTLAILERGELVPHPPSQLAALFRPSVQPYLISWLSLDPAAELSRVSVPTLVIQGSTDLQVTTDDARMLAAARPGIELVVIDGMNHVLKTAPFERAANIAVYSDPSLPVASALIDDVAGFLSRAP